MSNYHLFEVLGIEVEAAIINQQSLDILPWADRVMVAACGEPVCELERGPICWNNELAAHVIEIKTTRPVPCPADMITAFHEQWTAIRSHLQSMGATLLPGPVHPWMNPSTETVLWPHEQSEWYLLFDKLFNCRRHGWANLQSMHLNFPFNGDDEFARLHAGIRVLLPLLPALSAASPYLDGQYTGRMDERLEVYRTNSTALPEAVGQVIPEPAFSQAEYNRKIMDPLYKALERMDPDGVLHEEWINARGAIARFDRGSIEIRVIDSQECAAADLSIAHIVWHVLQALVGERWTTVEEQQAWTAEALSALFLNSLHDAEQSEINDMAFLRLFGVSQPMTTWALWKHLINSAVPEHAGTRAWVACYSSQGPLARRLLRATGTEPTRCQLQDLVLRLSHCQETGSLFEAG